MPYCTHCGSNLGNTDRFCASCGTAQAGATGAFTPPTAAPPPPQPGARVPPPNRLRPTTAALLCYIPGIGWIPSVIFMTAEGYRHDRYIRFHALQGLFLFIAYYLIEAVLGHVFWGFGSLLMFPFKHWGMRNLLELALLACQVVGIIRTARGEPYHLPVIGDLAERSMA